MQRLRLTFGRGPAVKYISHLDITRMWERVFRRAGLPLSYSQGFSPHPKISIAAPLALGVTSEAELLDVELERRIAPWHVDPLVRRQLPVGIDLREVEEVPAQRRALQAAIRFAEYRVTLQGDLDKTDLEARIQSLLAAESLPRERMRDREVRRYDLRPLIAHLWLEPGAPNDTVLGMRLQTDERAAGRPDEVLAALGLADTPREIHRTKLVLAA
jgi:radical SAM-linked protein